MVDYNAQPVIIAGGYSSSSSSAEIFSSGAWGLTPPIPISGSRFDQHSALVVTSKIFTFGGSTGSSIEEYSYVFDGQIWSTTSGLLKPNAGHRSILIGRNIYHVGGCHGRCSNSDADNSVIEKWEIAGEEFRKEIFDFQYTEKYVLHPEVFATGSDFCQKSD